MFIFLVACRGPDPVAPPTLNDGGSPGRTAFFEALGSGDYASLPDVQALLAEEAEPASIATAGFAHAWRLSESRRNPDDPAIVDEAALAVEDFDAAASLLPDDARLVGFRGSFLQAQGVLEGRDALLRKGWFDQVEARRRWPAWGLFTQAFGLVSLEPDDKRYQKGLDFLHENLEACAEVPIDLDTVDWSQHVDGISTHPDDRIRRACANTAVAPHNVEGFFLVFGDMHAKAGNLALADVLYATAADMDDGTWPFADLVADRRSRLEVLPELLAQEFPDEQAVLATETTVFRGPASCTVCHQR